MKKVKLILQAFTLVLAGVTLISGLYYSYKLYKADKITQLSLKVNAIDELTQIVEKQWIEGDTKGLWRANKFKCNSLKDVDNKNTDDSWLQCNPLYINCFLENSNGKVEIKANGETQIAYFKKMGQSYSTTETRKSIKHHLAPIVSTHLKFSFKKNSSDYHSLLLENNCKDTYLPNRVYGLDLNLDKRRFDYKWDNFRKNIYVDKYLVTNYEINRWIDNSKSDIKKIKTKTQFPLPATHLKLNEMKDYCAFHGKELMSAHVFDAMSFHPGDEEVIRSQFLVKRPFPWSKRKSKVFLYKAQKGKEFEIDKDNCRKAFVKECLAKYDMQAYDTRSASWLGTFQLLGGVMEAMHNPVDNKKNLMLSSQYINASSKWNQLGKRISWDGLNHEVKNFKFPEETQLETSKMRFKVGFRCMKVVYRD